MILIIIVVVKPTNELSLEKKFCSDFSQCIKWTVRMLDVILFENKSFIIEFLPGIETGAFFIFLYLKNFTTLKKLGFFRVFPSLICPSDVDCLVIKFAFTTL